MNFPVNAGAKVILFLKLTSFFEKIFLFFSLAITSVIRFKISQRTLLYCGCKSSIFLLQS